MKREEKKSPWRALVLSALVFPGAGQVYNGDRLKGYLLMALALIISLFLVLKVVMGFTSYYTALFSETPQQVAPGAALAEEIPTILLFLGILVVIWVYSMIDAYWVGKEK